MCPRQPRLRKPARSPTGVCADQGGVLPGWRHQAGQHRAHAFSSRASLQPLQLDSGAALPTTKGLPAGTRYVARQLGRPALSEPPPDKMAPDEATIAASPKPQGCTASPLVGTQLWTRLQAIDISAIRKDCATSRKSITKALLERSCHHALPRRGPRRHRRDGKRPTGHEGLAPGARRGGPWRGARRCAGSTAAAAGCDMPALLRCYAAPRLCDARSSASRPRSRATPPRGRPRRPRTQSGRSTPATAWSPRPPSSGTWCTRGVTMATSSRSTQPREHSCGPMPPAGRFARARPCSPTGPSSLAATTAPCTTCPPRALC